MKIDAAVETRRMGELERLFNFLHRRGSLVAVLALHIRGPLDHDEVRRALDLLQQAVPMLRVHVRASGFTLRPGVPYFAIERDLVTEGTTAIPLREVTGDWRSAMTRAFAMPLPNGKSPRLRVALVGADGDGVSRLIITADHAICDAPAFLGIAGLLLGFLADPTKVPIAARGLPPSLESRHAARARSPRPWEPSIRLPVRHARGGGETAIEERRLTVAETTTIREAARRNRTSVHGTVGAALLGAVRDLYGVDAMSLLSSFEFRRLCQPPVPPEAVGCYADALRTSHRLNAAFWDLARDIAFKLVTVAGDRVGASILKLPSLRVALHEAPRLLASGFRVDGVALTTGGDTRLGREHGPLILEDVTMGLSMHGLGTGLFLTGLEHEGAHKLMIAYAPRTVPTADIVAIADRTLAQLRDLPA